MCLIAMGRVLGFITLLILSGPCSCGCPTNESTTSCYIDCKRHPLSLATLSANQLHSLTTITIINCHVTTLNVTQERLNQLRVLDLSFNSIQYIDHNLLRSFLTLSELSLQGNSISSLSDRCLENSPTLRTLDISSNFISTLHGSPFELSHLVHLNVSHNLISTLTEASLRGLDKLQSIDLSSNLISVLDNSLFRTFAALQWLNLRGNQLAMLSESYFSGLSGLRRLDVSVNHISSVSGSGAVEALSGLMEVVVAGNPLGPQHKELMVLVGTGRRLQTVDASSCNLTEIPGALTWSIRHLKLANNQLAAIRRGDLDSYPLLRELDLSENLVEEVEEDALGRLEMLSSLILAGNKLETIPNSLPSSLQVLCLNRNYIRHVKVKDLAGLPHLKALTLKNTHLATIQEGSFAYVQELQLLDLSGNPLRHLTANVIAGPQRLSSLYLSHLDAVQADTETKDFSFPLTSPERLQVLEIQASPLVARQLLNDPAALAAFRDLHTLDLSYNHLTELRSDLFHFLPRLERLGLMGNQWRCKQMLWLSKWMQQHDTNGEYDDVRCSSPPHLQSRRIKELTSEDFLGIQNSGRNSSDISILEDLLGDKNVFNASKGSDSKLNHLISQTSRRVFPGAVTNSTIPFENKLSTSSFPSKDQLKTIRQVGGLTNNQSMRTHSNVSSIINPFNNVIVKNVTKLENSGIDIEADKITPSHDTFPQRSVETSTPSNENNTDPTKLRPSLRNANKMGSRSSSKNITAINEMLLLNKSSAGRVFDKMMRDLFINNPLRANDNFTRVRMLLDDRFGKTGSPRNTHSNLSESDKLLIKSSLKGILPRKSVKVSNADYDDEANSSMVWGTIKSISNIDTSQRGPDWNDTHLAIGIVHTSMTSVPVQVNRERERDINEDSRRLPVQASDAFLSTRHEEKFESTHPGMFVLIGLAIALVVIVIIGVMTHYSLKRRRAVEYSRQQDIEVRSMSTVGELW